MVVSFFDERRPRGAHSGKDSEIGVERGGLRSIGDTRWIRSATNRIWIQTFDHR